MTINELIEEYDLDKGMSLNDMIDRRELLGCWSHPVVATYLESAFIIELIYGHVEAGNLSSEKARELTCYVMARDAEKNK